MSAAVMLFTCLPYLVGVMVTPRGSYYSGLLGNPDDGNVYLSLMRQARDGSCLFSDLFTSAPQRGLVLNLLWLKLGLLARVTHLGLPIVYHLARLVSGWLLLMAVYCLAAQVLSRSTYRMAALVLAATASGFGWLFHAGPGQPNPIDYGPGLVMPEAITFLTLLYNPLFAASVFLLVVIYLAAAHAFATGSVGAALLAGAAALVLGNLHSYDLIPVVVVLGVYLIVLLITRRAGVRALLLALLMGAMAAPSLLYQLWLQRIGEVSILVKTTDQFPTPALPFVLLGFGLPLLLALFGLVRAWRGNDWARLLALWFLLGLALIYLPLGFQRKLIEGLYLPICLLAMLGFTAWVERFTSVQEEKEAGRTVLLAMVLLILLCLPSNLLSLTRGIGSLLSNNLEYAGNLMPPLYLTSDQRAALAYLDSHHTRSDVVLANSRLSNYMPSLSGARVYLGHWSETPKFTEKIRDFHAILSGATPDAARETFLRTQGITYFVTDRTPLVSGLTSDDLFLLEKELPFDPDSSPWLAPVFSQGDVTIYRLKDSALA